MDAETQKWEREQRREWLKQLAVTVEMSGGGVILHGTPAALSRVCQYMGFKNACARGRVFITASKARFMGLR